MSPEELTQIENEFFTKIVIDELKRQRANGITDFLLDKYTIDKLTSQSVKDYLLDEH